MIRIDMMKAKQDLQSLMTKTAEVFEQSEDKTDVSVKLAKTITKTTEETAKNNKEERNDSVSVTNEGVDKLEQEANVFVRTLKTVTDEKKKPIEEDLASLGVVFHNALYIEGRDNKEAHYISHTEEKSVGKDGLESEKRRDNVDDKCISNRQDNSCSSTCLNDIRSCSNKPSDNWEEELKQFEDFMPPDIRMDYIDVLILYCEDDRKEAQKFQKHLREEITIRNGPIKTLLYDDAETQAICGSKLGNLAIMVQRSTFIFIFMTKHFIEDKWCEFSSESCLMEAIENKDKQWCVVPVYTEKRNTSFRVPMGLNTLKGINYHNNDMFYKNGVARLIEGNIYVRIKANEKHKIKRKEWLETFKKEQAILKEQLKVKQSESESDDESSKSGKDTKTQAEQLAIINIYQPGTVQIGDHNTVYEQNTENEHNEAEEEERVLVSRDSELPYIDSKTMQTVKQPICTEEKQKMKKVEIVAGFESHGEIPDQPSSNCAISPCYVNAAPSTFNKLPSSDSQHET